MPRFSAIIQVASFSAEIASGLELAGVAVSGSAIAPLFEAAGTCELDIAGIAAALLAEFVAAGSAAIAIECSGSATVTELTGSGTVEMQANDVVGAATLPEVTGSGNVAMDAMVAGAAVMGGPLASGAVAVMAGVSGAATMPEATGTGTIEMAANHVAGAATLAAFEAAGTAEVVAGVSGAATLDAATAEGAIALAIAVSGSATVAPLTASGAINMASDVNEVTGDATLDELEASGSAELGIAASGAATLDVATGDGSAEIALAVSGAAILDEPGAAAALVLAIDAAGAASLDAIAASGAATVAVDATGAALMEAPVGSATVGLALEASGAATLAEAFGAGTTALVASVAGSGTLADLAGAGAADVAITAEASASLTSPTASGAAELDIAGSGAASLTSPTAAGTIEMAGGVSDLEVTSPSQPIALLVGKETVISGTMPSGCTLHGLYWDAAGHQPAAACTVDGTSWSATLNAKGRHVANTTLYVLATIDDELTYASASCTVTARLAAVFEDCTVVAAYYTHVGVTTSGANVTGWETQVGAEDLSGGTAQMQFSDDFVDFGRGTLPGIGTTDSYHNRVLTTTDGATNAQPHWRYVIAAPRAASTAPHWQFTNEDDSNCIDGFRAGNGVVNQYAGATPSAMTTEATNLPGSFFWYANGASSYRSVSLADGDDYTSSPSNAGTNSFIGRRIGSTGSGGYGQAWYGACLIYGTGTPSAADLAAARAEIAAGYYEVLDYEHPTVRAFPPSGIVTITATTVKSATLSIPRHKVVQHADYPDRIHVAWNASSGVPDLAVSTDAGNTWTLLRRFAWDYHCSIDVLASGNVLLTASKSGGSSVWVFADPGIYYGHASAEVTINNHSGSTELSNVCCARTGTVVDVFTRVSGVTSGTIAWNHSTDGGATFGASGTVRTCTGLHRIGSCAVDGANIVITWEQGGSYCTIQAYRWDGVDSFDSNGDALNTTSTSYLTRGFSVTAIGKTIHVVWWDIVDTAKVLRHAYRDHDASSWSTPTTVETYNDDNHDPILTHVGTTLYAFYLYDAGSYVGVYYRTWTSESGWSERSEVSSSSGGACRYPQVPQHMADDAEWIPVMWTQGAASPYNVQFKAVATK